MLAAVSLLLVVVCQLVAAKPAAEQVSGHTDTHRAGGEQNSQTLSDRDDI